MSTTERSPVGTPSRGSGPQLLGFQLADRSGHNIQGDDEDPLNLMSFQIMTPAYAVAAMGKLGGDPRYLLMPIFEGDIEEPSLIGPSVTEISQ
ncbi:hypothetical protein [Microvirga calopogonii]|uniref:hypothetical protein n=1 Tax=Microvirga calopogonii TaxID=2078013 RepID=UPI000E0CFCCA|nr:hypothetical protein [Microvirga calopogonii]